MKYLKKFENTLEPELRDCFDGIDQKFEIAKECYLNEEMITIRISFSNSNPTLFEINEDMKEEIICSIGRCQEIGYKLNNIALYNGNFLINYYYSILEFEDFKGSLFSYTGYPLKNKKFKFDKITKIEISFFK